MLHEQGDRGLRVVLIGLFNRLSEGSGAYFLQLAADQGIMGLFPVEKNWVVLVVEGVFIADGRAVVIAGLRLIVFPYLGEKGLFAVGIQPEVAFRRIGQPYCVEVHISDSGDGEPVHMASAEHYGGG